MELILTYLKLTWEETSGTVLAILRTLAMVILTAMVVWMEVMLNYSKLTWGETHGIALALLVLQEIGVNTKLREGREKLKNLQLPE